MKIAQFSDCHLFADKAGLHHHANVYQNLKQVLADIKSRSDIDILLFTGDLSQDHSDMSYQNFVTLVEQAAIAKPVYYLSGNHDDPKLLDTHLSTFPFNSNKLIENDDWQVLLLNSKGETPAGMVDKDSLAAIKQLNHDKFVLLAMHHHAIDVGFGIDKHGLINKQEFWQQVEKNPQIKAIVCGHVHNAFELRCDYIDSNQQKQSVVLYTSPATSVEFDRNSEQVKATEQGPGYQIITLKPSGEIAREVVFLTGSN